MPSAEIIAIGTELLLGEIQDTNTRMIARFFRDQGIDLFRTTIIGDNETRISEAVKEALSRADIVITTGGLGPTVDDPTRDAIAKAIDTDLEFRPELWQELLVRYNHLGRTPTENNRKQAFIPRSAQAIQNRVGTAPGFFNFSQGKMIISLPGVPKELEYLLENEVKGIISSHFNDRNIILAHVIHTAGAGESVIDELIADLELLSNPTVGILAHPGQTDIRITSKAKSLDEAQKMISKLDEMITERLGNLIFGYNNETLEEVTINKLRQNDVKISFMSKGVDESLKDTLRKNNILFEPSEQFSIIDSVGNNANDLMEFYKFIDPHVLLVANLEKSTDNNGNLYLYCQQKTRISEKSFQFSGHQHLIDVWAINTIYNFLRTQMCDK